MVKLNIQLDDQLKAFVDQEIAAGRCRSLDDYFAGLVRDQIRQSALDHSGDEWDRHPEELERLIQEGYDSGDPAPWTKADADQIKRRVMEKRLGQAGA